MSEFSVGGAASAGFQLIGRRPLSVLAWGLFYFVTGVLPVMGLIYSMAPQIADLARDAQAHPDIGPPVGAVMSVIGHAVLMIVAVYLAAIVVRTMMLGAVFRAVLEPKNNAFAYLRLGSQELWLFVVMLVMSILFPLCFGLIAAFTHVLLHFLRDLVPGSVGLFIRVLFRLACFVGFVWVALRLSMALPMTFAERRFRLFESWSLTRGNAGNLLLVMLLLFVIVIAVEFVLAILCGVVLIGFGMSLSHQTISPAFFEQRPEVWMNAIAPYVIGGGVLLALLIGPLEAIFLAPWAAAYRMLKPE